MEVINVIIVYEYSEKVKMFQKKTKGEVISKPRFLRMSKCLIKVKDYKKNISNKLKTNFTITPTTDILNTFSQ